MRPAEPVLMRPLVEDNAVLLFKTCAKPESFTIEPNVVALLPVTVKERFTEPLNVMSVIVRAIFTPLEVPVPAFVNSTESPFAG